MWAEPKGETHPSFPRSLFISHPFSFRDNSLTCGTSMWWPKGRAGVTGERCEKGRKGRMKRKDVYSHLHLPTPGIRHPFRRIDGVWLEGGGRRCRKMKIENINQEIEIIKTTYDISLDSKNFFVTKRILPPRDSLRSRQGRRPLGAEGPVTKEIWIVREPFSWRLKEKKKVAVRKRTSLGLSYENSIVPGES